jgi:hypothetical protein
MLMSRREVMAGAAALAGQGPAPQVKLGPHAVSRLIVGGNPVSANSHLSSKMSREMLDYFTAASVKKLLSECEQAGINTWQSRGDRHIMRLLHEYRLDGGRIQWIAAGRRPNAWRAVPSQTNSSGTLTARRCSNASAARPNPA